MFNEFLFIIVETIIEFKFDTLLILIMLLLYIIKNSSI